MKRKASYVRLHNNVYAPGVGELGNTFPSQGKTLENLSIMAMGADGVIVKFSYRGVDKELLLPAAAVAAIDLVPSSKDSE